MAAARSIWKGFIRFSLVSVPVKAYTATGSETGGIAFNQIHKGCNTRIKQKKTCPIHGDLANEDIVSGYQIAEDQYVVIDTSELEKLRTPKDRAIDINAFIPEDAVDPVYFTGKTYYLVPETLGAKPYALLHRTMVEQRRNAIAQVVFTGKEQLVLLRIIGGLVVMSPLNFASGIKSPGQFEAEVPKVDLKPEELALAKTLIEAMVPEKFDLASYPDRYTERLTKLVEAKIANQDIIAVKSEEPPMVTDLMQALQLSVAEAEKKAKPPKQVVSSEEVAKPKAGRKKKTS